MTEVQLVRQRIRPGKSDRLRAWFAELERREEEVIATLESERAWTETVFIDATGTGDSLYYYLEAEDLDTVFDAFEHSDYDIDEQHREVLSECLVEDATEELEPLFHVYNPKRPE
jgi:hypothetical protein